MKKLAMILFGAFLCSNLLSCEEPSSIGSSDPSLGGNPNTGGSGSAATPEILYIAKETSKGKEYQRLGVCNADGSNGTSLINTGSNASTSVVFWGTPSWSGNGGAFSYIESDANRSISYLKTSSISVVNGLPVASNLTTIKTTSVASDSASIGGGIWSPAANEIAYSIQSRRMPYESRQSSIHVMSSNGGSDAVLYTTGAGKSVFWMSYSPDGSKIAFIEWTISSTNTILDNVIKIMDRSTGVISASYNVSLAGHSAVDVEWSRTGKNVLAFSQVGSTIDSYTLDLDAANPTSTALVSSGRFPTWSPTNDRIMYSNGSQMRTVDPSTLATTAVFTANRYDLSWKR